MNIKTVFLAFASTIFCICESDTMDIRYCRGIYNDRVRSLSNAIFAGVDVDKENIETCMDFLDNRDTSPSIDSTKYVGIDSINSGLSDVRNTKDKSLIHFAENCRDYFNSVEEPAKRIAVSFLLHGVIEKCKNLFKFKQVKDLNGSVAAQNTHRFGVTFDKSFVQIWLDKLSQ